MLNVSFLVGAYIIDGPCSNGPCRTSGLLGRSVVSDNPQASQDFVGSPKNSPQETVIMLISEWILRWHGKEINDWK